nr:AAA family ATPase [Roseofilum capinflatum]
MRKTTTTVNLAAILLKSRRTLLVDADPQGSASWWCDHASSKGLIGSTLLVIRQYSSPSTNPHPHQQASRSPRQSDAEDKCDRNRESYL